MSTVAANVGRKIKGDRPEKKWLDMGMGSGRREGRERHERREGREGRGREVRAEREGFESSSDWFWGSLLLIAILFVLSPGVLLTLPPGAGGVWMSGKTSVAAAFVHALLIVAIFNYI